MGEFTDKISAAGNKAAGAVKEALGDATADPNLEAKGEAQKAKAPLKTSRAV